VQAPQNAKITLNMYTVRGQLVRSLASDAKMTSAVTNLVWDGRDGAGKPLASGSYVLRLSMPGQARSKVVIAAE
jgi:flagellar hook assembly protein FlgD